MAKNANQSSPGLCHWGLYDWGAYIRRRYLRVLRRKALDLRGAYARRLHAISSGRADEAFSEPGNRGMSVRKSAGIQGWSMGSRADKRKDEGMSMAQAEPGRAIRISRMDARQSSPAFQIHFPEGRRGFRERFEEMSRNWGGLSIAPARP